MKYILAIDQGTTSTRAILFDKFGQIHAQAQQEIKQYFPKNDWVEQDPKEIWQSTLATCENVIKQANSKNADIAAIGIANQRETSIVWNKKTGQPIYNAIVWQDRRTTNFCEALIAQKKEDLISTKTGLLINPYFSATKIRWLLDNVPEAQHLAEQGELAFGTVDSFLLWHLTKGKTHATDATNASRTLLFNIHTQQWDQELLNLFNIPLKILPQVMDCADNFGITNIFGNEIPIAGIAGDQQSALIGQACFTEGSMKCTYGTGAFLLMNTGNNIINSKHKLLATTAYRLKGKVTYALEGSIFAAGTILQWLRDQLHLINSVADSAALAASVADNGGVYFIPAFTGLGAPYWKANLRAAITGLTRDSTAAHIVRAGLEAVVYQTHDLIKTMISDGVKMPEVLKIDGGMAGNVWLLQFLADILNITIERPEVIETTALGVAYLAGLQIGLYNSLEEIASLHKIEKKFTANLETQKRAVWCAGWQKQIDLQIAE